MNNWPNTLMANGIVVSSLPKEANAHLKQELEYVMRGLIMNFSELPEMVIVETRFITQKAATEANIETAATLENEFEVKQEKDVSPLKSVMKPRMADANTNTESSLPSRERGMQTEDWQPTTATVAIQCRLEEDLEIEELFGAEEEDRTTAVEKTTASEEENARFLEYVKSKSFVYSNGKRECLICGEIKEKARSMRAHMALHWGPAALCFQCGAQFEHSSLLDAHDCHYKRKSRQQINSAAHRLFRCPHYRCSVVAISMLELYDHINEHAAEYLYRCSGCQRSFRTAGELRRHLPLRLNCLEQEKRHPAPYRRFNSRADATYRVRTFAVHPQRQKRVIVKSFLSQRKLTRSWNSQRRCQICLQRCSNAFKFANHTKRCLKVMLYRLERKRFGGTQAKEHQAPLLNGH